MPDVEPLVEEIEQTLVTTHDAAHVEMATLKDGGFVVTWRAGQDIYAQVYDADGAVIGDNFLVNTITNGAQQNPEIGALENGGFVIIWDSYHSTNPSLYGAGQVFDSTGAKVDDQFEISIVGNEKSVIGLEDGSFAVFYQNHAQHFSATGIPLGNAFSYHGGSSHMGANQVSAAQLANGDIIVVWDGYADGDGYGVMGQLLDSDLNQIGEYFQVNAEDSGRAWFPSVDGLAGGGFAVAWTQDPDDSNDASYVRVFDADGQPLTDDMLTTDDGHPTFNPTVIGLSDGGFSVVAGGYGAIIQQRYDEAGNEVGDPSRINDLVGNYGFEPSGGSSIAGELVFAWDQSGGGVQFATFSYQAVSSGTDEAVAYSGGGMNDILATGGGDDTVSGGDGDDTLQGDGGADVLFGENGDDFVDGGADNDTANGGDGDDTISGGSGRDTLDGGKDKDVLFGGLGDDDVAGGGGNDQLYGDIGNDILSGDGGNDVLYGGVGNDAFDGGAGFDTANYFASAAAVTLDLATGGTSGQAKGDTYVSIEHVTGSKRSDDITGDDGDNRLKGMDGWDTLSGGNGDDTLEGGGGNDVLDGGNGADDITGGSRSDNLSGGAGDDTLDGGTGFDTLTGGAGDDMLTGGAHADTFVFASGSGDDTVTDFTAGIDALDLSGAATDFADLDAVLAAATETSGGLLIDLGGGDSVLLTGIGLDGLSADDLIL